MMPRQRKRVAGRWVSYHGVTLLEVLLGLGLAALAYAALLNALPTLLNKKNDLYRRNAEVSTQVLRETMRTDLQTAGGSAISILEDSQLYICRYEQGSTDPQTCKPVSSAQAEAQGMDQKYCIASATPFNKPGSDESMVQYFAYRGLDAVDDGVAGGRLEYFFGQQSWKNRDKQKLIDVMSQICKSPYDSRFAQLKNIDWILMNTPNVNHLKAFMVCGVNNNSFKQTLSDGPPNKCLPVLNQALSPSTPGEVRQCIPGENGVNSLFVYYQFENRKVTSLSNTSATTGASSKKPNTDNLIEDVFVLPLWSLPCTNEDRDAG